MKSWKTSGGQTIYRLLQGRCNCYLIESAAALLLVDCGSKMQRHSLLNKLKRFNDKQKPLNLVLTHSHFDHAANTASLVERYHPSVLIQRNEAEFLRHGENPDVKGTILFTKLLAGLPVFKTIFHKLGYTPVEADILVDDNYALNEYGVDGTLLHTPGHSPGSMSIILENEFAIVGDTMSNFLTDSVLPTYALDVHRLVNSWHRLLESGCSYFLPGHGWECSRKLVQKQYEYYRKKNHCDR